ncbi:MAG TPA: hypothetical protein ENK62_03335, partial [Chromatiales bacterium]|nr:hypothetical protein [Chromatiales bacterium]
MTTALPTSSAFWRQQVRSNPALRKAATPRLTRYIPYLPTPKQAAFLLLTQREAFYGGAAGGGKSDALLMGALQYVDVPGYSALVLRRSYADLSLPGALMDRSKAWLSGTDAVWNEMRKTWHFPSGATLTFGYLEREADKYRYQGAEFQYIAFDELTQFSESQYKYLFSRLRRLHGFPVPLRMRSASNPGGMGHEWVMKRFITNRAPGRIFIPANLDDNPHLDRAEYEESLSHLDKETREQLLKGDWFAAVEGLVWGEFNEANITDEEPDPELPIELAFDDGYIDPRAILFIQRRADRILVFDELYQVKTLEEQSVQDVLELVERRGLKRPEIAVGSSEANQLMARF